MARSIQEGDARNELMSALSTLHVSGRYSDLTVVCNERRWAVHKAIVCSRSGFFDGACGGSFREAGEGLIDLSDDDEEAVDQMIHYFYYLDYLNEKERQPSPVFRHRAVSDSRRRLPKKLDLSQIEDPLLSQAGYSPFATTATTSVPPQAIDTDVAKQAIKTKGPRSPIRTRPLTPPLDCESEESEDDEDFEEQLDDSHLLLHTKVYALAEKFDIPGLKDLARSKFEMAMACFYDSPEFAEAIEEVYTSTVDSDRGLRDIVLQAFRSHPQLASTQDVFAVIKETPTLAFELFKVERGIPV